MGLTKSEIFSESQNQLAVLAKVLGHPARVAILQHLLKVNACIGGDLVEEIGLAQPTISQHLKELKKIGIIRGSIEGTSVCYCIDKAMWQEIANLFAGFFNTTPEKNSDCGTDSVCC